jgi:hypothetical protein
VSIKKQKLAAKVPKKRVRLTEIAWAAGFFDGEGHTGIRYSHYKTRQGKPRKGTPSVHLSVSQVHKHVLTRFYKAIGSIGNINGPYQYSTNKQPHYVWSIAHSRADYVFHKLKPYLCSVKKQQYKNIKVKIKIVGDLNREENRKTFKR